MADVVTGAPGDVRRAAWRGRRVFLTGHTGFKGSWLAAWLLAMGAQLRGFALAPDLSAVPAGRAPLFDELGLAARMDHVVGDVRDRGALEASMAAFDPEIVIHMAAQPLVRLSYREPVETYATNVMGTAHLLDACRRLPALRAALIVTSDKCYENREQIWGYRETDPMGGRDPYSNSKGCAELVTAAFRASFFPAGGGGAAICSARAGNVIGGGDWSPDRLIPDAARAHLSGRPAMLRNPGAVRPWQHVLDPLDGYLTLLERVQGRPDLACGWNFGPEPGGALTVADVIALFGRGMGPAFSWGVRQDHGAPHEATLLDLDCAAARARLGWRPCYPAAAAAAMTADWYRLDDAEARAAMVEAQIAAHLDRDGPT